MTDYKITDTKILFDLPGVRIVQDTIEHDDHQHIWTCLEGPANGVVCVALTADSRIVLTQQYRHAVRQVILDLPAGRVGRGESLEGAIRRELKEETGYTAGRLEMLGRYVQFPSTVPTATNIFLATELIPGVQQLDAGEELEVVTLPVAEALNMVLRGEIIDGSLQLGILLAARRGLF